MCDYSLKNVKSRPAQIGDSSKRAISAPADWLLRCSRPRRGGLLAPGDRDRVRRASRTDPSSEAKTFDKVAIFRQFHKDNPHRHHDFLEFPNGEVELLTRLDVSQCATVLQLPATPNTEAEREEQRRAEYAV